ncbi:MAG TPA: BrnT family toxin [Thermoanaerobaculia bacterium]
MARYKFITWTETKANKNFAKHGVSFEEARDALDDPLSVEVPDTMHSVYEDRFFALAESPRGRMLAISYTIRGEVAWFISARRATPSERRKVMKTTDIIRDRPFDEDEDPLDHEIDFSNAKPIGDKFAKARAYVLLDSDVCDVFRTADEVNNALRLLIREGRVPHLNYPQ